MSLFGKKEKKSCCCSDNFSNEKMSEAQKKQGNGCAVKILGGGCDKCNQLEKNTIEALKQLGMETSVDHVVEFAEIASYGVMTTPALVYNGKVICYGKVLKVDEIAALIQK